MMRSARAAVVVFGTAILMFGYSALAAAMNSNAASATNTDAASVELPFSELESADTFEEDQKDGKKKKPSGEDKKKNEEDDAKKGKDAQNLPDKVKTEADALLPDTDVPPNASAPRELTDAARQFPDEHESATPTLPPAGETAPVPRDNMNQSEADARVQQSGEPENIVRELRKKSDAERSGEKLEKIGREVRKFEQSVAAQEPPGADPATIAKDSSALSRGADAPKIVQTLNDLRERGGLILYTDSDRDGISDYDERNVYGTDPYNAHTAGDALSDGERILRGLDVHSQSSEKVTVESPTNSGPVSETIFEVTDIHTESVVATSALQAISGDVGTSSAISIQKRVVFGGRALPNSFVTLYIYSTPIVVTVKTDENGNWKYALDTELPDGTHNLYIAMVNNDGRIIAKSPAIPFVKRAEAVEYAPLMAPPIIEPSFIDTLRENLLVIGGVLTLLIASGAVLVLGIRKPTEMPTI